MNCEHLLDVFKMTIKLYDIEQNDHDGTKEYAVDTDTGCSPQPEPSNLIRSTLEHRTEIRHNMDEVHKLVTHLQRFWLVATPDPRHAPSCFSCTFHFNKISPITYVKQSPHKTPKHIIQT